jgi:hypothetical protein
LPGEFWLGTSLVQELPHRRVLEKPTDLHGSPVFGARPQCMEASGNSEAREVHKSLVYFIILFAWHAHAYARARAYTHAHAQSRIMSYCSSRMLNFLIRFT